MQRFPLIALFLSLMFLFSQAHAYEGMFYPEEVTAKNVNLAAMQNAGLELTIPELKSLAKGSHKLSGAQSYGSTAFVSPNGLLLTNYHVAYACVLELAASEMTERRANGETVSWTVEERTEELLAPGFLALTPQEEIHCPDYELHVLLETKDVTDRIYRNDHKYTDPADIAQARKEAVKEVQEECKASVPENQQKFIECTVSSVLGGTRQRMEKSFLLRDIRAVLVPPINVGYFGGQDIDNFEFPRKAGDFSIVRAYWGPDHKPADFDREKNVPYVTNDFLKISDEGFRQMKMGNRGLEITSDFVGMFGYPGTTQRYLSALELAVYQLYTSQKQFDIVAEYIAVAQRLSRSDPTLKTRLRKNIASNLNSQKRSRGAITGMERNHTVELRRNDERKIEKRLASDKELGAKYGTLLEDFKKMYSQRYNVDRFFTPEGSLDTLRSPFDFLKKEYLPLEIAWHWTGWNNSLNKAQGFYAHAYELAIKNEAKRRPIGYAFRDEQLQRRYVQSEPNIVEQGDIEKFTYQLNYWIKAAKMRKMEKPGWYDRIERQVKKRGAEHVAESIIRNNGLNDIEFRGQLWNMSRKEFENPEFLKKNPIFSFVIDMYETVREWQIGNDVFSTQLQKLKPQYIQLLAEVRGQNQFVYDDANSTKRFTWGQALPIVPPRGPMHGVATDVSDIIWSHLDSSMQAQCKEARDTDDWQYFGAPKRICEMISNRKGYTDLVDPWAQNIPVVFVASTDTTGGNSGSNAFNSQGHVVGCKL